MKNDINSSFLTKEEVQEIENVTVRQPDEALTFAEVIGIKQITNPKAKSDVFYTADDDEGAAQFLLSLADSEVIGVSNTKVTFPIEMSALGWRLKMDDIENSRSFEVSIDTESIQRATYHVNAHMNQVVYSGDTKYGFSGLSEVSGVTAIVGTTLIDANNIIGYFNSLPRKFRNKYSYSLVVGDDIWKELVQIGNTTNDKSIADQVTDAIPNLQIVNESEMDAGTSLAGGGTLAAGVALFVPKSTEPGFLPVAESPSTTREEKTAIREVEGNVFSRFGPIGLVFPTAFGRITSFGT